MGPWRTASLIAFGVMLHADMALAGAPVQPSPEKAELADKVQTPGGDAAPDGTNPPDSSAPDSDESPEATEAPPAESQADDSSPPDQDTDPASNPEADGAFDSHRYLQSYVLAPAAHPELQGIDAPSLAYVLGARRLLGGADTGSASALSNGLRFTSSAGVNTIAAQVMAVDMWSPPVQPGTRGISQDLSVPSISWSRQDGWGFSVQTGTTPLGGLLPATPVADITVEPDLADWLDETFTLSRDSVSDSVRSYSGTLDGNVSRGRVVENALHEQFEVTWHSHWVITGGGMLGWLDGANVPSNLHQSASFGAAYQPDLPGFEQFRIGPAIDGDHYQRDEEEAVGASGGYFSPKLLRRYSLRLEAQTDELKSVLVAFTVAPEWQCVHSSANSSQSGLGVTADAQAALRLTPRLFLTAFSHVETIGNYRDFSAGLGLTVSFGQRNILVASDLPNTPLQ